MQAKVIVDSHLVQYVSLGKLTFNFLKFKRGHCNLAI